MQRGEVVRGLHGDGEEGAFDQEVRNDPRDPSILHLLQHLLCLRPLIGLLAILAGHQRHRQRRMQATHEG